MQSFSAFDENQTQFRYLHSRYPVYYASKRHSEHPVVPYLSTKEYSTISTYIYYFNHRSAIAQWLAAVLRKLVVTGSIPKNTPSFGHGCIIAFICECSMASQMKSQQKAMNMTFLNIFRCNRTVDWRPLLSKENKGHFQAKKTRHFYLKVA